MIHQMLWKFFVFALQIAKTYIKSHIGQVKVVTVSVQELFASQIFWFDKFLLIYLNITEMFVIRIFSVDD